MAQPLRQTPGFPRLVLRRPTVLKVGSGDPQVSLRESGYTRESQGVPRIQMDPYLFVTPRVYKWNQIHLKLKWLRIAGAVKSSLMGVPVAYVFNWGSAGWQVLIWGSLAWKSLRTTGVFSWRKEPFLQTVIYNVQLTKPDAMCIEDYMRCLFAIGCV